MDDVGEQGGLFVMRQIPLMIPFSHPGAETELIFISSLLCSPLISLLFDPTVSHCHWKGMSRE